MNAMLAANGWEFGVGDPTVLGWTITVAYAVAAWMTLRAAACANAWRGRRITGVTAPIGEGLVRFWLFACVVVVILGLNKQLDLQRLLTETARAIAKDGGWYRDRKPLQYGVMAVCFLAAMGVSCWMAWTLRGYWRRIWLVVVGVLILAAYVVMRGTSHHDVDALMRAGPVPLKDSMELVGIACIMWSAWRFAASAKSVGGRGS
ncbi:MAG: hypothetical protein RL591_2574 [Planctomycetota bacterium]|jgi:hypothetical protein